jgi:hypothetical protein
MDTSQLTNLIIAVIDVIIELGTHEDGRQNYSKRNLMDWVITDGLITNLK